MSFAGECKHRFETVGPMDMAKLTPRPRVIDVRQPEEFSDDLGHLPGAELVPLATLPHVALSWSKEDALLLVCRSGGRSSRAAEALVQLGFKRVLNLEGGMLAVADAKLAVER